MESVRTVCWSFICRAVVLISNIIPRLVLENSVIKPKQTERHRECERRHVHVLRPSSMLPTAHIDTPHRSCYSSDTEPLHIVTSKYVRCLNACNGQEITTKDECDQTPECCIVADTCVFRQSKESAADLVITMSTPL